MVAFNTRDANIDVYGYTLFAKIHGVSADVLPSASHTFEFDVPYAKAYFNATEIVYDVKAISNLNVEAFNPSTQAYEPYQQYGFDVCVGEMYTKECSYAATVMQGVRLKCTVTNLQSTTVKMGVNFHLHEAIKL